ncbi:MAG: cell division protein FtsL [Rhodoferax sp.]|jgi:cell division protein FtsL|nr:cell division protein FtsL [Rhodoferax sp.]MBP9683041.1 cell division protein FtsL [Rhodoferax sp.]
MIRLNLVLSLAVLVSSLYLVTVQYESRQLFSNLDKARSEERRLIADNAKLQVEKRAQATSLRVEKLAREKLQMRSTTPAITHYVSYGSEPLAAKAQGMEVASGASDGSGQIQ